ncbi:acyl carrier protein [Rhodococcus sp. NPDC127528]|uniref:acyl carrier protein n=1 Tax=unclassified Rhodococcus (in: high G+C Gram-positive bacteria) TaxID=192944 RepID=UPI00362AF950
MEIRKSTLDGVKAVIVTTLAIEDRADTLEPSTPLFGSMPELDSMAVVQLVVALEKEFGFEIDDSDVTGDAFETVGSLASFVEKSRG